MGGKARGRGGKAHGKDRDYQVQCRDLVMAQQMSLVPFSGDGIDVAFNVGHTTISVDVALKAEDGSLVLIECKRHAEAAPQALVYAFAAQVEDIRKATGFAVVGLFYAKSGVQIGALATADSRAIGVVQCAQDQPLPNYTVCILTFDAARAKAIKAFMAQIHETTTIEDSVTSNVHYTRDSSESVGASSSVHSEVIRGPGHKPEG